MSEVMRVTGLKELQVEYKQLPDKLKRGVIRRGVYAAARVVAQELKRIAPVHGGPYRSKPGKSPGTLKRGVITKRSRELETAHTIGFVVTILRGRKFRSVGKRGVNKDAFYWPWVDQGHRIVPRRSRVSGGIAARRRASAASGRRVAGLFFMERALRATAQRAVSAMAERMKVDLAKPKVPA